MPTDDNANLPFLFTSSRFQRLFYRCPTQTNGFILYQSVMPLEMRLKLTKKSITDNYRVSNFISVERSFVAS